MSHGFFYNETWVDLWFDDCRSVRTLRTGEVMIWTNALPAIVIHVNETTADTVSFLEGTGSIGCATGVSYVLGVNPR